MGYFKTLGLLVHAEKLAAAFANLRKSHFTSIVHALETELEITAPFGRSMLGGEADLALQAHQMLTASRFVYAQRYIPDNNRREFLGALNIAAFGKSGTSSISDVEGFMLHLNQYRADHVKQVLQVATPVTAFVVPNPDNLALTITSSFIMIFGINTQIEIAREFKDKTTFELLRTQSESARSLLATKLDPPRPIFCCMCSRKLGTGANFCSNCGCAV